MKHRSPSLAHVVGVVAMLCAWLAVSNHCALAMMGVAKPATGAGIHSCCPAKPNSEQAPVPQERSETCCKVLRVLLPDAESARPVSDHPETVLFVLVWADGEGTDGESRKTIELSAAGPPEWRSFAEVVLQRSVLSHAPPSLA